MTVSEKSMQVNYSLQYDGLETYKSIFLIKTKFKFGSIFYFEQ